MKKIVFALGLMMGFEAVATEAPEKFQNPIFNDMLYSNGNRPFSHDIRVTPTSITDYDYPETSGVCEYILEDEKGFLLKCQYPDFIKGYETYEMFYARYQSDFTNVSGKKWCEVWNCSFEVKNGKIESSGNNAPISNLSNVLQCDGEKDTWKDFQDGGPKMNCLDELKERGWDKYIPGKWEKKINTWQ
ncbi:MAG: hypothetical protein J6X42_04705 [Alphaproteobacteria bacterium]|nr:hypothetical protein [Alphaproteobacteria bacterium]